MLDDSLADFKGQVKPPELGIAQLEVLHDAQSVQVVIEDFTPGAHLAVERPLAGVSKWRMPNVMHQRKSLSEVAVQTQRRSHGARNLRDLDGVRQPIAKMIGAAIRKDLRLILKPAKSPGVDHAIAIALKIR